MSDDLAAASMTTAEQYRKLASQLRARAHREESPRVKAELASLAECYIVLAERADRNGGAAVANEITSRRGLGA